MSVHRWEKGQSGNPKGRPKRTTEEQYLNVFKDIVTVDEVRLIVQKALLDAKRGDQQARKFVFDYLLGPPVERNQTDVDQHITLRVVYGK